MKDFDVFPKLPFQATGPPYSSEKLASGMGIKVLRDSKLGNREFWSRVNACAIINKEGRQESEGSAGSGLGKGPVAHTFMNIFTVHLKMF